MTFTYDPSTALGKVRLTIPDKTALDYVFTDEELTAFYSMEGSNVKKAAALALETIASEIGYTDKVIKLLDLQTDGAKTLDSLLKRANILRDQAEDEDVTDHFDFIEFSDLTDANTLEWYVKNVDSGL